MCLRVWVIRPSGLGILVYVQEADRKFPHATFQYSWYQSTIVPETLGVAASSGPELGGDVDLDKVDGELKVSLAVGQ